MGELYEEKKARSEKMISRRKIIEELAERMYGDTRPDAIQKCTQFCDTLVDIVAETLDYGENIQWKGFLTMELVERSERHGKNPKTNEVVTFPPVTSIRCRLCKSIRDRVNNR